MTNDLGDHTGLYFHESKSKLETKLYGRNWNIRVWVIFSNVCPGIPWNGSRSWASFPLYRNRKIKYGMTPTTFPPFSLIGFKRIRYSLSLIPFKTKIADSILYSFEIFLKLLLILKRGFKVSYIHISNKEQKHSYDINCNIYFRIKSSKGNFL